jgi:hypothetical protein
MWEDKRMKYQAQIRHINGDIITVIWDNNKRDFESEIIKASSDLVKYVESDIPYNNEDLYIKIV